MLSSLGRNGFVESLALTRYPRSSPILRRRLRHASFFVAVAPDALSLKASSAFTASHFGTRSLSTSTPPETTNASESKPQPPPPAAVLPLRKHKVELRPGPVKPAKLTPQPPTSPKPSTASSPNVASEPSSSKKESIVEATKHDLVDASQHGILAPPPAGASWAGSLWHQAKELFKFYWRGIKLIWHNLSRARLIEQRALAGGAPVSRWELRFIRTSHRDTMKLVPFLFLIIVIEEIIPLVVLYAPSVLPSTCLLPSQRERIVTKKRQKQASYAIVQRPLYEQLRQRLIANPGAPVNALLDSAALTAVNGLLSLSTVGPSALLFRRLQKHLAMIADDDALLKREASGSMLSQEELREALEERGIRVTEGLAPSVWQSRLQWWLKNVDGVDEQQALLCRVLLVASSGAGKF
ncbi:uncharacterized protein LAESUDRAFT_288185 [Laetiporus sulphureus 93-53]|uniref:Letm1 RBD domain-containing protein n=1 Tax=Laetiporus sulphureus 93-53 TaxID=1314785 RepID=A0A165DD71_9APHY|nr:uncharacterized protein LAESUDRAFT_288185 [Laetiporus sulphureus 93-53]KZT04608.1 hypothetical protein LAESUDRAFT_288185 [Laetiporus sulphureus 93-53]